MDKKSGGVMAYLVELSPQGFIIVGGDEIFTPVVAYSYENDFGAANMSNPLLSFLTADLAARKEHYNRTGITDKHSKTEWQKCLEGESKYEVTAQFQWPKSGTTPTGGWLKENWTQNAPYNNLCPMDPVTSSRSLAGCPAIAMGMILNFLKTTNRVRFSDQDDYRHSYSGRVYWIDNDFASVGFPSFPQLNIYLDTLESHYLKGTTITNNDKAALVFASAVAARQVFTSQASGTFGVDQAKTAYDKFNFRNSSLLWPDNPALFKKIALNVIDTLPVHFAAVTPDNSAGHNFVVDGYNTDDFYHLNMGWGGTYNSWYKLPAQIPYNLTVVEGVIVDIATRKYDTDGNDRPVDAIPIQLPFRSYENKIFPSLDVDWYRFNVGAGSNIKIHTESFGCFNVDTKIWLYGPCNQDASDLNLTRYIAFDDSSYGNQQPAIDMFLQKPGTYYLRVSGKKNEPGKAADYDETGGFLLAVDTLRTETMSADNPEYTPASIGIINNFPNPFNPSTTIIYHLLSDVKTSVKVYDLLGNEVAVLLDEFQSAGEHKISWNAASMPSGIYLCELKAGSARSNKKLLLLK